MWHAKITGGYAIHVDEALDNATEICSYLLQKGYTLEAASAIIGNISREGGLNPWRWEADEVLTTTQLADYYRRYQLPPTDPEYSDEIKRHGYGLVGFTPATNYINNTNENELSVYGYAPNFADLPGEPEDGQAQTIFFERQIEGAWQTPQWAYDYYYWTFDQVLGMTQSEFLRIVSIDYQNFKTNDLYSISDLTGAFELLYEKPAAEYTNPDTGITSYPAAQSFPWRRSNAEYFYEYFLENPPPDWNPILSSKSSNWKFYLFL